MLAIGPSEDWYSVAEETTIEYSVVWLDIEFSVQRTKGQAIEETAEYLLDWIDELKYLSPQGDRFLTGFDVSESRYNLFDSDNQVKSPWVATLHFPGSIQIVANSTELALERGNNWCRFVERSAAIARDQGMPLPKFAGSVVAVLGEPTSTTIHRSVADILYTGWDSWTDVADCGVFDEVMAESLRSRLRENHMTFQSDGFQELIGSLDEFAQHLKKAQSCSYHWRWAIEALHSALQNAMVLALAGTWDVRTLKPHHAKKLIAKQHIEFDANLRATAQLDSFPGLYGKIQDPEMMGQYTHSRRLEPSPSMDEAVSWLNVTRNELKHFRVQTVLFDAAIWPKFCIECLAVIRFLVHDSNNIFWFRRSTQIRAARALVAAENATERIRGVYESEI